MDDGKEAIDPQRFHILPHQSVTLPGLEGTEGWILDIGGGGEGIIGQIAGRRVVAVDLVTSELEECSNESLKIVMDARDLKFLDGSFDTVTSFFSFMFMPWEALPKVLSEIARVLRPGGRLLVWDYDFKTPPNLDRDGLAFLLTITMPDGRRVETGYGCRVRDQSVDDLARLAGQAGLRAETTTQEGQTFHVVFRKGDCPGRGRPGKGISTADGERVSMAKQFQCPFCAFNVTAESEEEVLKHVQTHKADHHQDKDVSEDDIRRMMRSVEAPRQA